jgi:hypothetical protein
MKVTLTTLKRTLMRVNESDLTNYSHYSHTLQGESGESCRWVLRERERER